MARPLWILQPGITRFSKSCWWEQIPLLALCKLQALFPLMLWWFFALWWFSSICGRLCVQWDTGEELPKGLSTFSLCPTPCPVNSSCFGLPALSALSSALMLSLGLCPGSSSLHHTLEMLSRQWFGGNYRTHFFCPQRSGFFVVVVAWCTVSWKTIIYLFCLLSFGWLM